MKLRRCPIFYCVFLFCPAIAAAADTTVQPCAAKEPSEWQARIDKEPAERESAETGAVERERVAPALTPLAVPAPLALLKGDAVFRQAYEDVYSILSAENECSRLYGGAAPAAYVFNQLAGTFKSARVGGSRVAGQMGGGSINVRHEPSGLKFRLFEKAVINTGGAFYRRQNGQSEEKVPRVGSFAPDTRGARALILLHELGHVVRGEGERWVLEDDGGDPLLSERNTQLVEEHCIGQLKALGTQTQPRSFDVARSPAREPAGRDSIRQQ
ncbi:MAG TPA: hypothetical protein VK421_06435 [Pyrinomonadaceae bacterium]|nr:hypothetical protein [Pyrinomonadaceae bacterium]